MITVLLDKLHNCHLTRLFLCNLSIHGSIEKLKPLNYRLDASILVDGALHLFKLLKEANMPVLLVTATKHIQEMLHGTSHLFVRLNEAYPLVYMVRLDAAEVLENDCVPDCIFVGLIVNEALREFLEVTFQQCVLVHYVGTDG